MDKILKIGLAIGLLICLLDMPYGYFQLVRLWAMIGFGYLAFLGYSRGSMSSAVTCITLAVLFQPLIKISLGRPIWNAVDVIVAIGLLATAFDNPKRNEEWV